MDDHDDDAYDAEEAEMYQDLQFLQDNRPFRPNMRKRVQQRFDPFDLSPREFYVRYRFSKESVQDRLIPLLLMALEHWMIRVTLLRPSRYF